MKKIFTAFLVITALSFFAQTPPVIESTYYPVRNTSIKQVWDTSYNTFNIPTQGPNQVWDYRFSNNQFLNVCDTFQFKILDPALTPYKQYFPGATQAVFIRTPFRNFSDSLYNYFKIDQNGLYSMGGFNIQKQYDSTMLYSNYEFLAKPLITYLSSFTDTAKFVALVNKYYFLGSYYKVKVKSRKIKTETYSGYGTLKLPNGIYNDVALVTESNNQIDSIYVDLANNGSYSTFITKNSSTSTVNKFLRNNTFGSAYLMFLNGNPSNTIVESAWYTLPIDFGSISGKVFTNTAETTPVTSGEMYLYRENSNFAKNDILAKTNLDAMGNYKFDSIPYGEYRIAVRPDTAMYANSLITYHGDTTDWISATSIITTTTTSTNHKIHLRYSPVPVGSNFITGQLGLDLSIFRTSGILAAKKIPSIGVVVKKNPGSSAERVMVTDTAGKFTIPNLNDGNYKLFVDIPGLHHAGTYTFSVNGGSIVTGLDFTVGTDSIHPINTLAIGIKENKISQQSLLNVYPNPYQNSTNIIVNVPTTANVLLEVYNMLGEKIQTIDNSQKQLGTYIYDFSAKNLNYSWGMYFVKLTTGKTTNVIKIIEQ